MPGGEGGVDVTRALFPFQRVGVDWLAPRRRALLGDDMGLGKSVQILMALPRDLVGGAVIVCPAVVKHNWADEVRAWRPDLRAIVLSGRGSFRWPRAGEIVITNYAILPKDTDVASLPGLLPGCYLIGDEIHAVKGSSQRRKAWLALRRRVRARQGTLWGATGTALLNNPVELWKVLSALDCEKASFGSWSTFVRAFDGYKGRFGWKFRGPTREVPDRLRRVMLRRLKKDVLPDLPPKRYKTVLVELNREAIVACDAAAAALAEQGVDLTSATLKAVRTAAERPGFTEMSRARKALAAAKFRTAEQLVEFHEQSNTPLVVLGAHKAPIQAIGNRPGWASITGDVSAGARADIVRDFRSGRLSGVALTIRAGGVGITLTRASDVLRIDRDWTPALNRQAVDRTHRIGQTRGVLVTDLVADHVLDHRTAELLVEKESLEDAVYGEDQVGDREAATIAPAAEGRQGELF